MKSVFEASDRFCFVHHRALNSRAALRAALAAMQTRPDLSHAFEGDLCWDFEDGRADIYLHHPWFVWDGLSPARRARDTGDGPTVSVDEILASPTPGVRYIFELKVGRGDRARAMQSLVERLEAAIPGRYWIAAFSVPLLGLVRRASAAAPTSLHTPAVWGARVLNVSPEWPLLTIPRIADLSEVDSVTMNYRFSHASWLSWAGCSVESVCREVAANDKALILGGCTSPALFERASRFAAVAGYAKFPIARLPVPADLSPG